MAKRILIMHHSFSLYIGGAGVYCRLLATELFNRDWSPFILIRDPYHIIHLIRKNKLFSNFERIRKYNNIISRTINLFTFVILSFFISLRLVRNERIQIINAHDLVFTGIAASMVAFITRRTLILHEHGSYWDLVNIKLKNSIFRPFFLTLLASIMRFTSSFAKIIITDDSFTAKRLRYIGIPEKKIVIINPYATGMVSSSLSRKSIFKEIGIKQDLTVIGFVGRFSTEKNIPTLIKAYSKLRNTVTDIHLILVGDGPQKEHIKNLIYQYKLEKYVTLTGFRYDVERFYKIMDVLVLPSFSEGLPRVIREAFELGVPIVASRIPTIVELSENGKAVSLFDPNSVEDLTNSMLEILSDDRQRNDLIKRGHEIIINKFNKDNITSRIIDVYRFSSKSVRARQMHNE